MKSWEEFAFEEPTLATTGKNLLFQSRPYVGYAFLATLRKDDAPRLHPICLVFSRRRLYVLIPPTSPKCADLKRDGRYALQGFPPQKTSQNEEFYIAGRAECIEDFSIRQAIIDETNIEVEDNEVLFELLLDRVMYTTLVNPQTPDEHPVHIKWRSAS